MRVTLLSPLVGFAERLYFGLPAAFFPDSSVKYALKLSAKVDLGQPSTLAVYHGATKHSLGNASQGWSLQTNPKEAARFGLEIIPAKPFEPISQVRSSPQTVSPTQRPPCAMGSGGRGRFAVACAHLVVFRSSETTIASRSMRA